MMKCVIVFNFLCMSVLGVYSQQTFRAADFSDRYYGKIFVEKPDEVFSPGWVTIYDKKNDKELVRVESEELAVNYDNNKEVTVNVQELPYGEQSVIIYDDFNFDGIKDFAIQDGQNSCYHGPSYVIYLSKNDSLEYSEGFTRLAQEYCGMFDVDSENKKIHTMTKSGCCWHEFSVFDVKNNSPRLIQKTTEKLSSENGLLAYDKDSLVDGKMITEKTEYIYPIGDMPTLFSFNIAKNGKKVILYEWDNRLVYAFTDKNGVVEFLYPDFSDNSSQKFVLKNNKGENSLLFSTSDAHYRIYSSKNKLGIEVTTKGKIYTMAGDPASQENSLTSIISGETNLVNVTYVCNE